MSRSAKLVERFKKRPSDFQWSEMVRLLEGYGYSEGNGRGSRKVFEADGLPRIRLHRPHPSNIVKRYVIDQVIEILEGEGLL